MVPCAGPVLAAVAALAASGQVTWRVVLVTVAYSVGHAVRSSRSRSASASRLGCASYGRACPAAGGGVVVGLTAVAIALNVPERLATAVPVHLVVPGTSRAEPSAQRSLPD